MNAEITDYTAFRAALEAMDKPRCVQLARQLLEANAHDIVGLYTKILAPVLNSMTDSESGHPAAIWREHVRSGIVRTVIECCYPFVLAERAARQTTADKGKGVIVSPTDEFHELGARMGSDFFTLQGYEAIYVGANTPKAELLQGLALEKPAYVVINAVNFYNLFKIKKIVAEIKERLPGQRILASGNAFYHDPELFRQIGALAVIRTPDDIRQLEEEHA